MVIHKTLMCFVLFLILPSLSVAQDSQRNEAGLLLTGGFLREIGTRDVGVGTDIAGFGGRVIRHVFPFLDLEGEVNFLPGNSATSGNHVQGLFGAKAGVRFDRIGLFVKARPGFMHFSRDPFGVGKPGTGFFSHDRVASTELSGDIGGVVEYYTKRGLILRFDLGNTIIRYDRRTVRTSDFVPSFEAGGFTTHNWQGSFGLGFRF